MLDAGLHARAKAVIHSGRRYFSLAIWKFKIMACQDCSLPVNGSWTLGSRAFWAQQALPEHEMPELPASTVYVAVSLGSVGWLWFVLATVMSRGRWTGGQDEWATGVRRSLDRKVSLYPQERLFKIALSPNILLMALGPSVLWFKIIWQLSFLQSENGFWGYKIISELSQLAQPR